MMRTLVAAGLLVVVLFAQAMAGSGQRVLTAVDAIESARILVDQTRVTAGNPHGAVSISPNGTRYMFRVAKADVERNGIWVTLMAGSLESFSEAARPRLVASLFTTALGSGIDDVGADRDVSAYFSPVHWLDESNVAFLWAGERHMRQVARINLTTGRLDYLTNHPTPVTDFAINRDGAVLYNALEQERDQKAQRAMEKAGYSVPENADGYALFNGFAGRTLPERLFNREWFLIDGSSADARKITFAGREVDLDRKPMIYFAPDAKRVIVDTTAERIVPEWSAYSGNSHTIPEALREPLSFSGRHVHQFFLVDLEGGGWKTLWPVPHVVNEATLSWSPDGRRVLIAPTYLPLESVERGGTNSDAAVIVDVSTGEYRQLPIRLSTASLESMRWIDSDNVEISAAGERQRFQRVGQTWERITKKIAEIKAPPIRIELRENPLTPPRLYAVSAKKEQMIFDPNPDLTTDYTLGRVEKIAGELASGEKWAGLLFYPVGYSPRSIYPLVIQSDYSTQLKFPRFTLYGDQGGGLGPPLVAAYPGQVLANRGMAVVHMDVEMYRSSDEGRVRQAAFEAVVQQLVDRAIVDKTKVGLLGFSRNGYWVEYAITHSDLPFAAASAVDNWNPSYISATFTRYPEQDSIVNGGSPPFGEGLKAWTEHAIGFNADKIHTPLRKVLQSGGLLELTSAWELFSRLSYLKRPVELYVMPDAKEHAAHNVQNPRQVLALMQGSVDWFDFWLRGYEDPDPEKTAQYQRWRRLRDQRDTSRMAAASGDAAQN